MFWFLRGDIDIRRIDTHFFFSTTAYPDMSLDLVSSFLQRSSFTQDPLADGESRLHSGNEDLLRPAARDDERRGRADALAVVFAHARPRLDPR